jgi:hypothetical protein
MQFKMTYKERLRKINVEVVSVLPPVFLAELFCLAPLLFLPCLSADFLAVSTFLVVKTKAP